MDIFRTERYRGEQGRGTQVVRERSAKPLCVGSIPTRASNLFIDWAASPGFNRSFLCTRLLQESHTEVLDRTS
jgi:hypothetical protein